MRKNRPFWTAETHLATLLGGYRADQATGLVVHDLCSIVVKHRSIPRLITDGLEQAAHSSQPEKIPVVVIHDRSSRKYLACFEINDSTQLAQPSPVIDSELPTQPARLEIPDDAIPGVFDMIAAVYRNALWDDRKGDNESIEWLEQVLPDWRELDTRAKDNGRL